MLTIKVEKNRFYPIDPKHRWLERWATLDLRFLLEEMKPEPNADRVVLTFPKGSRIRLNHDTFVVMEFETFSRYDGNVVISYKLERIKDKTPDDNWIAIYKTNGRADTFDRVD